MSCLTRVLIIDGTEKTRKAAAHQLRTSSPRYDILEAQNGQEGLQLYETKEVDCVVLDEELPDMLGFRVLVKLVSRGRQPKAAVVVLTKQHLPITGQLLKNYGAQACLVKDRISGEELNKAVQQAIAAVATTRKAA
jgi:CheY-like chemotaxis protein